MLVLVLVMVFVLMLVFALVCFVGIDDVVCVYAVVGVGVDVVVLLA